MSGKLSFERLDDGRWSIVRGQEGEVGRVERTTQGAYFVGTTKREVHFDDTELRAIAD